MDLRNLGSLLREERERRGLSLEEISDKIKISKSCLAAIEEGDEARLPHPVYAKGFIRNYARLLGIDNEEFLDSLSQIYTHEEAPLQHVSLLEEIPEDDAAGASGRATTLRIKRVALAVALVVLVVAGVWLVHGLFGSAPKTEQPAEPVTSQASPPVATSQSAPAAPVAEPAPTPQAENTQPAPAATSPTAQTAAPQSAAPTAPTVSPAQSAAPEATSQPAASQPQPAVATSAANEPTPEDRATQDIALSGNAAQAQTPPAPPAPPAPTGKQFTVGTHGPHEVTITSSGRCWIQAGADGGTMRDTMLEAGDSFIGRFSNYLLVRLGNAGAVEIHFDGKLYPLHASKGSVKTLKFLGRKDEGAAAPETSGTPETSGKAPAQEQASAPVKADAAAPVGGEKKLEIFGKDGSWVILMPDAGPSKEVYIKKGQSLTVPFNAMIEVKLGNPSSVVFHYDGKETPVTTERGESRTIRFP